MCSTSLPTLIIFFLVFSSSVSREQTSALSLVVILDYHLLYDSSTNLLRIAIALSAFFLSASKDTMILAAFAVPIIFVSLMRQNVYIHLFLPEDPG